MPNVIRTPTTDELASLPRRALAAFATRFARRLFAITKESESDSIEQELADEAEEILEIAEAAAAHKHMREWAKTEQRFGRDWFLGQARRFELNRIGRGNLSLKDAISAVADTLWVVSAIASVDVDGIEDETFAITGITGIVDTCNRRSPHLQKAVWDDFCSIRDLAIKKHWTHSTPVSSGFWALHSRFDLERLIDGRSILSISSFINERLVAYFRKNPQRLHQLTPRQFEELIAELWDGFGFEVELTRPTVDGGCDVVAIQHVPSRLKYLIECKRYRFDRNIGVHTVRQLGGVVLKHLSSTDPKQKIKGILATTSAFTAPAREYLRETRYWLEGADSNDIIDWLEKYDKLRIRRLG